MADYYQKLEANTGVHAVSIPSSETADPQARIIVKTMGSRSLSLKPYQIPDFDPHRINNTWRYPSNSDLSQMLSGSGQALIQIIRGSGSGHVKAVTLRMEITNNTGSDVSMNDAANILREIEFQTPAGEIIQTMRSDELWMNAVRMHTMDEWGRLSKVMNSNNLYGKGNTIANGDTVIYYLPLTGCYLAAGEVLIPAIDGDLLCWVRFNSSTTSVISGSAPSLSSMSLEVQMEQLSAQKRSAYLNEYKAGMKHFLFPYSRAQTVTLSLQNSSHYEINLSSIKGDVVWLDFYLRSSLEGTMKKKFYPITHFTILNNEGDQISGQQMIRSEYNRNIQQLGYFPGRYGQFAPIYTYVFAVDDSAPVHFLMNGQKLGSYPFSTYERLAITTAAAGSDEYVAITPLYTPTAGNVRFKWTTPESIEYSDFIAFSDFATVGVIESTIEAMKTFDGTVTVTGSITAGINVHFQGIYGQRSLESEGYILEIIPDATTISAAGVPIYNGYASTPGFEGMAAGTYILDIVAYTTSILCVRPDGGVEVRTS